MLLRASSTALLLLFTSCQSTRNEASLQRWQAQMEASQAQVRYELEGLCDLLVERALEPATAEAAAGSPDHAALDAAFMGEARTALLDDPAGAVSALTESLLVLERQHALHCENLANAGVPGYKRRSLLLSTELSDPNSVRRPEITGLSLDMTQGVLELTRDELGIGIQGEGFLEIVCPNGELRYTRDGALRLDVHGRIVTSAGYPLSDQIAVPTSTSEISVSRDGSVFALGEDDRLAHIGTIRVHVMCNPEALEPVDHNAYAPTASSGAPQARQAGGPGSGALLQGYRERSNVEVTAELIDLQRVARQASAVRRALASHGIHAR